MTHTLPEAAWRLRDVLLCGAEPPPAAWIVHLSWHPWLVVAVTCIGAFIGQLDASIVQLALPAWAACSGPRSRR